MNRLLRIQLTIFFCLYAVGLTSQSDETPIPADAQTKAIAALAKLGPKRGALPLRAKMLPIVGVVSGLKSDMVQMKKNLRDLRARVSDSEILIALSGDVLFDFDKWAIRKDAIPMLQKVLSVIIGSKSQQITISGHSDSIGSEEYNQKLSLKRAEAVRDWLMKESKLSANSFTVAGLGETKPIAPNSRPDGSDDPEGRQRNRRVEFSIQTLKGRAN